MPTMKTVQTAGSGVIEVVQVERPVPGPRGSPAVPGRFQTHVNRAMFQLGARDRAQLVVIAYETSIVRAGQAPPRQ